MYVRGGLYELVRKSILPTLGDRVTTSLAARKPEIVAAQVEEPSVATTGGLLSDLMLSAANIGAQIPNSSFIGPRGGGGGGGGGFRGGYGGGYRGGWAIRAMATGSALAPEHCSEQRHSLRITADTMVATAMAACVLRACVAMAGDVCRAVDTIDTKSLFIASLPDRSR